MNLTLLTPENLDIDGLIKEGKASFARLRLRKPSLYYILDALIKARVNSRHEMEEQDTRYFSVSSKLLDGVVHNYNAYLAFLIERGVIETDNHFIVGKKCKGYRFTLRYSGKSLIGTTINDYRLNRSIKRWKEAQKLERKKEAKIYGYLYKWWESGLFQIDFEAANLWIDAYIEEKIKNLPKNKHYQEKLSNIIDTKQDFKFLVRCIHEKNFRYSFGGESHRFYNPITNIKKELRNFCTYDGKALSETDVKNSQPFCLISLFDVEFWMHNKPKNWQKVTLREIDKDLYEEIRKNDRYKSIITLLKTHRNQSGQGFGRINYSKSVLNGTFYEDIQTMLLQLDPQKYSTRDKVKIEVLKILYSDPYYHKFESRKTCQAFQKEYPVVYDLLVLLHGIRSNIAPIILQRLESYLVIDKACKRIGQTNPNVPIYTIHDSIITTKENEKYVEAVLEEEIYSLTGNRPITETKSLILPKLAA